MRPELHFLIDECLHTSLVDVVHKRGYAAEHIAHKGMRTWKDHDVVKHIREHGLTFVTNNAIDFRKLYTKESVHAGLVIIVPNVPPEQQRQLLSAALDEIGERDFLNEVIEVYVDPKQNIIIVRYTLPSATDQEK